MVARRVWIAPDLRKIGPTGMGVRFLTPEDLVKRLKSAGAGRSAAVEKEGVFRIVLEDDKKLLESYAREISQGGLYIPTDEPPALNRDIVIEFVPPGTEDETIRADATVVQRVPPGQKAGGLPVGIAVAFDNGSELLHRLAPYLSASGARDSHSWLMSGVCTVVIPRSPLALLASGGARRPVLRQSAGPD